MLRFSLKWRFVSTPFLLGPKNPQNRDNKNNNDDNEDEFAALVTGVKAQLEEYRITHAPQPLTEQNFLLGFAPGRTARCRSCGYHFIERDVRLGVMERSTQGDFAIPCWHHLHCFAHIDRPFFETFYLPPGSDGGIFATREQLKRDLDMGSSPLTAALRAITGDDALRLTLPQQKEVNWIARRWAMAMASTAGGGGGRGRRKKDATDATDTSMSLEDLYKELALNYGEKQMADYLSQHFDIRTLDEKSTTHTRPTRATFQPLVADGRAFGAIDTTCTVCGSILQRNASGGATCTGYLDPFTACKKPYTAAEIRRRPWRLLEGRSAKVPQAHWRRLAIESEAGSVLPPDTYDGDFVQLELPIIAQQRRQKGRKPAALPGMHVVAAGSMDGLAGVAAPEELAVHFVRPEERAKAGAGDERAQVFTPEELTSALHVILKEEERLRDGDGDTGGGGGSGAFDFGKPAYINSTNDELFVPSVHPRQYVFSPSRWVGVAPDAAAAASLLASVERAASARTTFASRGSGTATGTGKGKGRGKGKGKPAKQEDEPLLPFPVYSPAWVRLCLALGHQPPFLDESPLADLYLLHKPALTAAQKQQLQEQRLKLDRARRLAESEEDSNSDSGSGSGVAVKRTDTFAKFRGAFPVDHLCDHAERYRVVLDNSGVRPFSMQLTKADLRKGQNAFYVAQVLHNEEESSNGSGGNKDTCFYVFRRWGRVGDDLHSAKTLSTGMTREDAIKLFREVFEKRTGNSFAAFEGTAPYRKMHGRFHFVPTETIHAFKKADAPVTLSEGDDAAPAPAAVTFDADTTGLLSDLFSLSGLEQSMHAMKIDLQRLPLGQLSDAALAEAAGVLDRLAREVDKNEALLRGSVLQNLAEVGCSDGTEVSVRLDLTPAEATIFLQRARSHADRHSKAVLEALEEHCGGSAAATEPFELFVTAAEMEAAMEAAEQAHMSEAAKNRILSLSNRFYSTIPHRLPGPVRGTSGGLPQGADEALLNTSFKVAVKRFLLDDLADVLRTRRIVEVSQSGAKAGVLQRQYTALRTGLVFMPPGSPAAVGTGDVELSHEQIVEYFETSVSPHHSRAYVTGVWRLERPAERETFEAWLGTHKDAQLPHGGTEPFKRRPTQRQVNANPAEVKRTFLWHGSRFTNWVRIFQEGLQIAPPHALATGYMFGKGVYFADMSSKAAQYSHKGTNPHYASDRRDNRRECLIALCEVAVGNDPLTRTSANSNNNLGVAQYSVLAIGETIMSDETTIAAGPGNEVSLPCGCAQGLLGIPPASLHPLAVRRMVTKARHLTRAHLNLLHNEYIVYDTAQIRIRYLVSFSTTR